MFSQILQKSVDNVEGGVAAVIMDMDGNPIDQYIRVPDRVDIGTVATEYSFILGQIKRAADNLAIGATGELSVKTDGVALVIRMLNPQYFVAMALTPEGNTGKARYMLRMAAPNLASQL